MVHNLCYSLFGFCFGVALFGCFSVTAIVLQSWDTWAIEEDYEDKLFLMTVRLQKMKRDNDKLSLELHKVQEDKQKLRLDQKEEQK